MDRPEHLAVVEPKQPRKREKTVRSPDAAPADGPSRSSAFFGDAPPPDEDLIRGFELGRELGRGAFGRVYRARDLALGREVALKILASDHPAEDDARRRFLREARILASLDHPNVVRVHSIDEHDGALRICLELIEGQTLQDFIEDRGPVSPQEAAEIVRNVCRALAVLHGKDLVHRDIKPANVMRAQEGRIVLLDFGLAYSPGTMRTLGPAGTPLFMSPEQVRGEDLTAAADLYSTGVLLYWLVTGKDPYEARTWDELSERILSGKKVPLVDRRSTVDPELCTIVDKAMAVDPGDRFSSAGELESALSRFLSGQADRAGRRRFLLGTLVLAVAVVAAAMVVSRLGGGADTFEVSARFERVRGGELEPLHAGSTVAMGDKLVLSLEVDRSLWVYLFNEDEAGRQIALFPLPPPSATDGQRSQRMENPVPAGALELPGRSSAETRNTWVISTPGGGSEHFLLAISPEPLGWAEELLVSADKLSNPEVRRQITRSIGALAEERVARPDVRGVKSRITELARPLESGPIRSREPIVRSVTLKTAN